MNSIPIGGTFVLNIGSHHTAPLPYNAPLQTINAALNDVYRAAREALRIAKTLRKRHNLAHRMAATRRRLCGTAVSS